MLAPLLLLASLAHAKPNKAKDANALIAEASYLVSLQKGKPADEVRALDKKLDALQAKFAKLGAAAVPALSKEAFDDKQEDKTRLWLVLYLQSTRSLDAFPPLRKMTLDPKQPDVLRDAAARAIAEGGTSRAAQSRALCEALCREPGPLLKREALYELSRLGCDDPSALETAARAAGAKPSGRDAQDAEYAIAGLQHSFPPSSIDALDKLLGFYAAGAPQRGPVLDALTGRADQLKLETARWSGRAQDVLKEETRAPGNAVSALRLLAALGDPDAAELVARYLKDPDPHVVVAAAETLAALGAREHADEVAVVYRGFYDDPRFSNAPGVHPLTLYDRLNAALKALK